jgi:glucans biosynthesis protein C
VRQIRIRRRRPRPASMRQEPPRYANQAVLPFYLLHEPVIVAAAWFIVRWDAPILVKYPVLVAMSFTATLVIYEFAVRHYRITRLLFGMKPQSHRGPATVTDRARPKG